MVAQGHTIDAKRWSPVLDALIAGDAEEAIRLVGRMTSTSGRAEIRKIREAFDLT
jgi:hypothetical protein